MAGYCIYLRKSRKDYESEASSEGETLLRHKKMLMEYAQKNKLNIMKVYEEIVSGDTIASRPVMQELLADVSDGLWDGVLVVEIERLARGDTMDQGLVAQAFKLSNTKIITPIKTYDPGNEYDVEYFEFGLFMSRREYNAIKRRLIRGREASAKEGKYVGAISPYGYEKVKIENDKGYTLRIIPKEAEVVRLIFYLYVEGMTDDFGEKRRLGMQQIARYLNEMRIPPVRNAYWEKATIRDILSNPVYAGKIRWGWRKAKKKMVDGKAIVTHPKNHSEDCILVKGLHEAIVPEELFNKAQELKKDFPVVSIGKKYSIKNPLAGIVLCGKCGRRMTLRKASKAGKPDYLVCHTRFCTNVSSPQPLVEMRLLYVLEQWYKGYYIQIQPKAEVENNLIILQKTLNRNLDDMNRLAYQKEKAFDFLEQGIYTTDVFQTRLKTLSNRIKTVKENITRLEKEIKQIHSLSETIPVDSPKTESILELYHALDSATQKNILLKSILEKAVYIKEKSGSYKGVSTDAFELIVYPKLNRFKENENKDC